jgi:hypothetical protein
VTGEITVHAEGTATITAYINGVEAGSIAVTGKDGGNSTAGVAPAAPPDAPNAGQIEPAAPDNPNDGQTTPTAPDNPADPVQPQPAAVPEDVILGREIEVIASQNDEGGVQNWRGDEMADSAVELPIIPKDLQLLYFFAAAAILALGGIYEYVRSKSA